MMKSYFLIALLTFIITKINGDQCSSNPCQNNAACENELSGFKCKCGTGYFGQLCENKNSLNCSSNLCQNNATCVPSIDEFICQCKDKFYGKYCENKISDLDCRSNQCYNNGQCVPSENNNYFSCKCNLDYYGTFCQNKVSPCASFPCLNNGYCGIINSNQFRCYCRNGYYGLRCEIYNYRLWRRFWLLCFLYGASVLALICALFSFINWIVKAAIRKRNKAKSQQQQINTIGVQNYQMHNPDLDPSSKQFYNYKSRQNGTTFV